MDIMQELEHVAHFSREEGRIPDAERLEAVLESLRALLQNAEPVAPEYFWNKGDEYIMQENSEIYDWAADNDYVNGDTFELQYSVTGTATFTMLDEIVKLDDCEPKFFTHPPKDSTEPTGEFICNAFRHKETGEIKHVLTGNQDSDFSQWEDVSIFKQASKDSSVKRDAEPK